MPEHHVRFRSLAIHVYDVVRMYIPTGESHVHYHNIRCCSCQDKYFRPLSLHYHMIFGWGRKREPKSEELMRHIPLKDAAHLAEEARGRRAERIITNTSNIHHRNNEIMRDLVQIRNKLAEDDLDIDDIDKRLHVQIFRGKQMLIDTLEKNTSEIKPIRTYEDMVRVGGELEHRIKKMGNVLNKQIRIIHIFAEGYAVQLKHMLEEMDKNRNTILGSVSRYQSDQQMSDVVTFGTEHISDLEVSTMESAAQAVALKKEIEDVKRQIKRAQKGVKQFYKSKEYASWLQTGKSLTDAQDAEKALSFEVSARFTSISRPLGRYMHISSDKEQKALLEKILRNPYLTMNTKDAENVIHLIEKSREAVLSGSISVKDVSKASNALILTRDSVPKFVERAREISRRIGDASDAVKAAGDSPLEKLKERVAELQKKLALTEKNQHDATNAAKMSAQAIPAEVARIQESLRAITGVRYVIEYTVRK